MTTFLSIMSAFRSLISTRSTALRPGVRFAYVKDPEGNLIELTQAGVAADL